jgi:uncharacterized protein YktB (UPF0637 family)
MFQGFHKEDFAVFQVPGLEPRMSALIHTVRPKLTTLGQTMSPILSALCGEEMFPHVAKHARRKVNPPNDTWVAWANNKRGYKALPHFQVGLWGTHVFVQFTIIYECAHKVSFANKMREVGSEVCRTLPATYYWSMDHTKPDVLPIATLTEHSFETAMQKLALHKNAEFLCGLQLAADDSMLEDGHALTSTIEDTFNRLLPLYRLAF